MEAREDKSLVTMGRDFRKNILIALAELEMLRSRGDENDGYYLKGAEWMSAAYEEVPDAFLLYRLAKVYLKLGNNEDIQRVGNKVLQLKGSGFRKFSWYASFGWGRNNLLGIPCSF